MAYAPEIIEFPAVLLNTSTGAIESEFQHYVQPSEHPKLSEFCKELTGITQAQVDDGIPVGTCIMLFTRWLKELSEKKQIQYLCDVLRPGVSRCDDKDVKWCTFVTWSDWDIGICLKKECERKRHCVPPALRAWIDLRETYKTFYSRKPNGLAGAMKDLGIQFAGRQHCGLDDARNTAKLAWRMTKDGCIMNITSSIDVSVDILHEIIKNGFKRSSPIKTNPMSTSKTPTNTSNGQEKTSTNSMSTSKTPTNTSNGQEKTSTNSMSTSKTPTNTSNGQEKTSTNSMSTSKTPTNTSNGQEKTSTNSMSTSKTPTHTSNGQEKTSTNSMSTSKTPTHTSNGHEKTSTNSMYHNRDKENMVNDNLKQSASTSNLDRHSTIHNHPSTSTTIYTSNGQEKATTKSMPQSTEKKKVENRDHGRLSTTSSHLVSPSVSVNSCHSSMFHDNRVSVNLVSPVTALSKETNLVAGNGLVNIKFTRNKLGISGKRKSIPFQNNPEKFIPLNQKMSGMNCASKTFAMVTGYETSTVMSTNQPAYKNEKLCQESSHKNSLENMTSSSTISNLKRPCKASNLVSEVAKTPRLVNCTNLLSRNPLNVVTSSISHKTHINRNDSKNSVTPKVSHQRSLFKTPTITPLSSKCYVTPLSNGTPLLRYNSGNVTPPLCDCGRRSRRLTVNKAGPNQGRFFYTCSVKKTRSSFGKSSSTGNTKSKLGCKFFCWEPQ